MTLLLVIFSAFLAAYSTVWIAVRFNETVEERVKNILMSIVFDVIFLCLYMIYVSGNFLAFFLVLKYIFLSMIKFDKTLRQ